MTTPSEFESQLRGLAHLPKAGAPPFLFTRILARLEAGGVRPMATWRMVLAGMAVVALLAINAWVLGLAGAPQPPGDAGVYALDAAQLDFY